jgi:outer membrane protein OmpA-like peptidoglycan-associated protein
MIIRFSIPLSTAFFAAIVFAQAPDADRPGFKDHPLFTRMPQYFLSSVDSVTEKPFEGYDFPVMEGGKPVTRRVEGHFWFYKYRFAPAGVSPSTLQVTRNYEAAATKIGGKLMLTRPDGLWTTIMISKDGKETWAYLQPLFGGREYHLCIVETEAMHQDVVANAAWLHDGLTQNGHVEVPGIFFDFAKSEVKPESEPALGEITKLLRDNAALKVWVVGHTDNVGSAESNLALSSARAAAVVAVLTKKYGISPTRLVAFGAGPFAPVATNSTQNGRAKNRRVELVAQP